MQHQDLNQDNNRQSVHLNVLENYLNREVICPKCNSHHCQDRGFSKLGQNQYSCVDCKHYFIVQPLNDKEGREIICPDCRSRYYNHDGQALGKQRYKCNDCGRKFILDPFNRGNLNSVLCRWCGSNNFTRKGIHKPTGKQKCYCLDCKRQFTVGATGHGGCLEAPEEFDFEHDVWTAKHLGYENGIHYHNKLNFSGISQYWLKRQFKKFILYLSRTRIEFSTLTGKICYAKYFSKYLKEVGYTQDFDKINRSLIIDFLIFLKRRQFSYTNTVHTLSTLKTFFETGVLNNWFYVEPALIRPEDWPKQPKRLPRFIPEEVMTQLNQHLDALPEPVMRMALVHIECGFRIGELARLRNDCLKSDNEQGWYIQYQMYKMEKEHTKPISLELAKVIQEQQQYIKHELGEQFPYLFCGRTRFKVDFVPEPKLMSGQSFIRHLKKLADEFDIKDRNGKRWNFQTHQFRHTVGTRMINAGVPQHIVQRYLGHESPAMTMLYAHIFDETLRKEIEKYNELRVVNFKGEASEMDETILSSNDNLEWFKKNVQARALEHGYCARPKVLGDCDIPGFDGCYNCSHWRTNKNFLPVLKDTLERTNNVLEKAQNCGWQLQVYKNMPIKENLEKVIKTLEADND